MTTEEFLELAHPAAIPTAEEVAIAQRALDYCRWAGIAIPQHEIRWFRLEHPALRRGTVRNHRETPQRLWLRVGLAPVELFRVSVHECAHARDVWTYWPPLDSGELEARAEREAEKAATWWRRDARGWR